MQLSEEGNEEKKKSRYWFENLGGVRFSCNSDTHD